MARRQARCDIYCWYFHMMYEGHGVCVFRQCGLVWRWMMQNTYEALKAPSARIISVTTSVSAKKGGQVKSCEWHHMATTLLFPTRWLCRAAAHITVSWSRRPSSAAFHWKPKCFGPYACVVSYAAIMRRCWRNLRWHRRDCIGINVLQSQSIVSARCSGLAEAALKASVNIFGIATPASSHCLRSVG